MTERRACPPAPGPLEAYAARFDDLFLNLAQRRGFREYLTGLLAPRDRNKTLTCLAGVEPVVGAGLASVQRLQYFLSESGWDSDQVNDRRLEMLRADPACAPHEAGVIVIDDSGDRKDGTATAHVGRQWLGRLGKTDNGVVTVTTVWTDGQVYYPLHAQPYTPAHHFAHGRTDPDFRTKPQIAAVLAARGRAAGFACRAVVADSAYSVSDDWYLSLHEAQLAYVVHLKPHRGTWAPADQPHPPSTPPTPLPGRTPTTPATGHRSSGTSATDTPRPGGPPTRALAAGSHWARAAWSWPPPTRPPCRTKPPGTWRPTCPTPMPHTPAPARTRPPTSPRSSGSTHCARGSSKATSRSRTNSAGPTSRSAPTTPSATTRPW
ncbi:MAG: Transposase [Mucilaginibacter sp.]|nr:Transposase [Mucilaginibacter sp.]